MTKTLIAAFAFYFLHIPAANSQYYYFNDKYYDNSVVIEIGASFGMMNSLTDLGGKKGIGKDFIKDLTWKVVRPCYGIFLTGMYRNAIGIRLEGTFGEVRGYDSILKDVKETTFGRYERNLSFKSRIAEFQLAVEIHPLMFKYYADSDPPRFSPYALGGIGYFSFDPQTKLNGQWYSLQPLRTEGQGFAEHRDRQPYKLSQLNYAAGAGVRYEINTTLNARLEVNHRFLNTDYLDDVSTTYVEPGLFNLYLPANQAAIAQQLANRKGELNPSDITSAGDQRGDPEDEDAYFTIQLKLSFLLGRQKR